MSLEIGDRVEVTAEVNKYWVGVGEVVIPASDLCTIAVVRMETGPMTGSHGGFTESALVPIPEVTPVIEAFNTFSEWCDAVNQVMETSAAFEAAVATLEALNG